MQIHILCFLLNIFAAFDTKFNSVVLQEPVAMSLKNMMLLVVVAICIHPSTSSPSFSFERIGKQKDNVIQALGGLKAELISPFAGIARYVSDSQNTISSQCFAELSLA